MVCWNRQVCRQIVAFQGDGHHKRNKPRMRREQSKGTVWFRASFIFGLDEWVFSGDEEAFQEE